VNQKNLFTKGNIEQTQQSTMTMLSTFQYVCQ